jgi:hypothetical protein
VFDETEILVAREMANVRGVTGDQIVNGNNAVTFPPKVDPPNASRKTRPANDGNRLGTLRPLRNF